MCGDLLSTGLLHNLQIFEDSFRGKLQRFSSLIYDCEVVVVIFSRFWLFDLLRLWSNGGCLRRSERGVFLLKGVWILLKMFVSFLDRTWGDKISTDRLIRFDLLLMFFEYLLDL